MWRIVTQDGCAHNANMEPIEEAHGRAKGSKFSTVLYFGVTLLSVHCRNRLLYMMYESYCAKL